MSSNIKLILLAGGKATRMWPLTFETPKALLPVLNVPILGRILSQINGQGFHNAVLSIGSLTDEALREIRSLTPPDFELVIPDGHVLDGTARETRRIMGTAETLVVYYADTLCDLPLTDLLEAHQLHVRNGGLATMGIYRPNDIGVADGAGRTSYGVADVTPDGRVTWFSEKPAPELIQPRHAANVAIFVIERELLERYPDAVDFSRDMFEKAATGAESPVFAFDLTARHVIDCGTPGRYLEANLGLLRQIGSANLDASLGSRFPGVTFHQPVVVGADCEIGAGSEIGPFVVLGHHNRIAARVRCTLSVLHDRVAVGNGADISDAIVGHDSKLGVDLRLRDAVLAAWSVVGIQRHSSAPVRSDVFSAFRSDADESMVIISPKRAVRSSTPKPPGCECVLCRGFEHLTPDPLLVYDGSDGWLLRVVPNLYPAIEPGFHEVVVETPDHRLGLEWMTTEEVELVLRAWRERYLVLRKDPRVKHIAIFKNSGTAAGASLPHTHSQILATPIVPEIVQRRLASAAAGRSFALRDEQRLITESSHYLTCAPFAPRVPYETWILPKASRACFATVSDDEIRPLALSVQDALGRLHAIYSNLQYNLVVETAPVASENDDAFCWHLRIYPRHNTLAGFELATGLWINSVEPVDAATRMRQSIPPA